MRFVFQSIMYRNFREGHYDVSVERYQGAIHLLSFKQEEAFPVGLLMKSLLTRTSLNHCDKRGGSLMQEFGLTVDQVD